MATKTVSKSSSVVRKQSPHKTYILESEVDFALAANTLAQNDVLEAIAVPANCLVSRIQWEVTRVEGAARNFAIGDGSTTNGYITSTTANSLASGCSTFAGTLGGTGAAGDPVTVTGYSSGKYYSTADTIDILAVTSGGLTTCKIKVKAHIVDFS